MWTYMYILWETYALERERLFFFFGLILFFYVKLYSYHQAHMESATQEHRRFPQKSLIHKVLLYTSRDPCMFVY